MRSHVQQAVDKYLEVSGKSMARLAKVLTPCLDDHLILVAEFQIKGQLSPVAARIVLKALYTARLARLDLMWTVSLLAREVDQMDCSL